MIYKENIISCPAYQVFYHSIQLSLLIYGIIDLHTFVRAVLGMGPKALYIQASVSSLGHAPPTSFCTSVLFETWPCYDVHADVKLLSARNSFAPAY